MNNFGLALAIVIIALVTKSQGQCPKITGLGHCKCDDETTKGQTTFICEQSESKPNDIRQIMEDIKKNKESQEFDSILISGGNNKIIQKDFTAGVKFKHIEIYDMEKLESFSPDAFEGTKDKLKSLVIGPDVGAVKKQNVFAMLKKQKETLTNLKLFGILTEVPVDQFEGFESLEYLTIANSKSDLTIKENAFKMLVNLVKLNLTDSRLQVNGKIPAGIFNIPKLASSKLEIKLANNSLDGSEFQEKSFDSLNQKERGSKQIIIDLENNSISYLNENVFKNFLKRSPKNRIQLAGNGIDCNDPRNCWLFQGQLQFEVKVEKPRCKQSQGGDIMWNYNWTQVCPILANKFKRLRLPVAE